MRWLWGGSPRACEELPRDFVARPLDWSVLRLFLEADFATWSRVEAGFGS